MIDRYSGRYRELGYNVRTLGWGSTQQQTYRFQQTLEVISSPEEKTLLDIGCGFGDYLDFLISREMFFQKYVGWDLNPDLINKARELWSQRSKNALFDTKNMGCFQASDPVADIGVMLGVLNLNLNGKIDNYEYSFQFIRNAFACVKEVLVVDFLSTKLFKGYPKEDFVFYHDPSKMLNFALSLSDNVVIKHNYQPNPQKEFMFFLYK